MNNVVQIQTKTVVPEPELQPDLLLYSLYAPTWAARKKDKKVTQQAKAANAVEEDTNAGSFWKHLLPDCPELDKVNAYMGATRQQFYLRTKPWGSSKGSAVGKAEFHLDMLTWITERKDGLKPLVAALGTVYMQSVAKAEFELQGMFDAADYPAWDTIEAKFSLDLSAIPLPNVEDIRVMRSVPEHIKEELAAQITASVQDALTGTLKENLSALYKPLAHMAVTLKQYHDSDKKGKRLFDSVVENVREIAAAVRMTNVTNDPNLEALAIEAEKLVDGLTTKEIKESDGTQILVGKKAQELANRIAAIMP